MCNWGPVLIDNGHNDPLEDPGGRRKDGDSPVAIGIKRVFIFWDGSYTKTLPISGKMGIEEAVVDN